MSQQQWNLFFNQPNNQPSTSQAPAPQGGPRSRRLLATRAAGAGRGLTILPPPPPPAACSSALPRCWTPMARQGASPSCPPPSPAPHLVGSVDALVKLLEYSFIDVPGERGAAPVVPACPPHAADAPAAPVALLCNLASPPALKHASFRNPLPCVFLPPALLPLLQSCWRHQTTRVRTPGSSRRSSRSASASWRHGARQQPLPSRAWLQPGSSRGTPASTPHPTTSTSSNSSSTS